MRRFVELFRALDSTTSTNAKIDALVDYFEDADDQSKLWTIHFLPIEDLGVL